jgi:hypothetical protein
MTTEPYVPSPEELEPMPWERGIGGADRAPYHPRGGLGWYFTVDGQLYGHYPDEASACEVWSRLRAEIYTDD